MPVPSWAWLPALRPQMSDQQPCPCPAPPPLMTLSSPAQNDPRWPGPSLSWSPPRPPPPSPRASPSSPSSGFSAPLTAPLLPGTLSSHCPPSQALPPRISPPPTPSVSPSLRSSGRSPFPPAPAPPWLLLHPRGSPGPTVRGRPSQRPLLRLRAPSLRRYPFLRGAPSLGPPPPPSPRGPLRCPELLLSAPSPGAVLGPPGRGAGAAPLTWDSGCGRAVCSPKAQQDGGPGSGQRRAQRGGGAGRCRSERVWSGPHHPDLGLRLRLQRWPRPGPAHAPPRGGVRVSLAPSLLPTGVHVSRGP